MHNVPRRIYCLLLRLHPAAFRDEFACDMALDFEEALRDYGPARLLLDATGSLARQWWAEISSDPRKPASQPVVGARPSLLTGHYAHICDKPFTPRELGFGLIASATKFIVCLVALSVSAGPLLAPVVYASSSTPALSGNKDGDTAVQPITANRGDVTPPSTRVGGLLHATAARPSFEVASIRPSAPYPESRLTGVVMHSDVIEIRGLSVKDVIKFAYDVQNEDEFLGGPDWIRSEKFDIVAKPGESQVVVFDKLSPTDLHVQMRLMVQSLLEERLHLKASFPTKDLPFFALVVAKGGFKCKFAGLFSEDDPSPLPPPPPGGEPGQLMHWAPQETPFPMIVKWIAQQPELGGRIVVDETRLSGKFTGDISWAPDGENVSGPTFFTALREQMGLKLLSEKGQWRRWSSSTSNAPHQTDTSHGSALLALRR